MTFTQDTRRGSDFALAGGMATRSFLRAPLFTLALAAAGSSATLAAFQLISVQDEIAIGQQAQAEIRSQVPQVDDATTQRYLDQLGANLARRASGPEYPYSFTVANQGDLNAFALPGGPVWINRGILQAAATESQVAGVVAHEIAHISQRHAADQLTKATVANGLLGLLGAVIGDGGAGAMATRAAAGLAANGFMLKFSRDDEREADEEGLRIMQRAGYDPRGMAEFMALLAAQQQRNPGAVEQFLSSHPAPAERVQEIQRIAATLPKSGRRDSQQFQQVKQRLQRMPPAPAPRRR